MVRLGLGSSPRAVALRLGAVAVAVVTASVVASDLATLHRQANELGARRSAVVATRDLPVGTTVRVSDLRTRQVHASQLPPAVVRAPGDAAGRIVTTPVLRDDFVSTRHLAARHRTGLDGVVPSGMRAMRILVTDAVRPRRGAAVDVLATFDTASVLAAGDELDLEALAAGEAAAFGEAIVIAEAALVIDAGDATNAEGAAALGVTVLVTPRQARELAFAATHGVLTLALVPPEATSRE